MSRYTQQEAEAIIFDAMQQNGGEPITVEAYQGLANTWRFKATTSGEHGERYGVLTDEQLQGMGEGRAPYGGTIGQSGGA